MATPKALPHLQLRQAEWSCQCLEGSTPGYTLRISECQVRAVLGSALMPRIGPSGNSHNTSHGGHC